MTGRIRAYWHERRYGYVKSLTTFKDEFFHCDNLTLDSELPSIGAVAEYDVADLPDGRTHAINMRVLPKSGGAK
jgi:hypothetical protein